MIYVILFLVLIVASYKIYPLRIYSVKGVSMSPTLKDGQLIFGKHINNSDDLVTNRIYVFKNPNGKVNVKRLARVRYNNENNKLMLYFLGDNKNYSIDSRDYGEVPADNIIMRVDKY